ncbi:Protein N-acetyltransferase, RimJ/RimL family [Paraoerskovia marina]|uniref:Protein N-acetyltransferase, RimJ/RimL family n=1 Tax=Paraoerskovia marina TaxID=545619 RepID=A0A1H1TC52_9CELL|nr:GNAT family protein [Paraoerskovia marina]SDS57546.1 Protein N-acetyltransferase, RimJ/RimL family [Paraoerskovia marina]
MEPFPLISDRVRLTVPTAADVNRITEICQDADIQRWTVVPSPYHPSDAAWFVDELVTSGWAQDTAYTWAIRPHGAESSSDLVGMIGLTVDRTAPSAVDAEIGFWLDPGARGHGLASAASDLVLDWAFDAEGLDAARVVWTAYVGNWQSRRVAWRCGFTFEGTVRRHAVQRGERRDAWIATLLPGDGREPVAPWPDDALTRLQEDVV